MFDSIFAVKFDFLAKEECDKGTIVMTTKSIFKAFYEGKNFNEKTCSLSKNCFRRSEGVK